MNQQIINKVMMNVGRHKQTCSNCCQRERRLPTGLEVSDLERIDSLVTRHRYMRRGEHVFHTGTPFQNLFAIRTGFFKTYE